MFALLMCTKLMMPADGSAPYGPVDVGGANFGSGANSFWPGTGSYSTFGLYADSNKELYAAGSLKGNNGLVPLVCPGGMCPLGVSTPAFPPSNTVTST
mmetsp:Transcript_75278/g.110337  ORF Transcript_75278/g.110337 Transcript_75278/m.110337 type:complete len:98 (+) Transcript_75278:17-310(+)|eukprot:CAMPEP_0179438592 /NCGR_PEP_ID=MMETSP0799-20121207/22307_1 /TAXON_ID=46947 /ORGANISM="Geminigera cryophila, Strain CCMP2564" /LENGTH=97 /DNA_ID=CAMNT_0021220327 /DNA_START=254 /DNA_END=547 /DNA_ORIENTATION=-